MLYLILNMNPQAIKIPDQNYDVLLDSTIHVQNQNALSSRQKMVGWEKAKLISLFYFILFG